MIKKGLDGLVTLLEDGFGDKNQGCRLVLGSGGEVGCKIGGGRSQVFGVVGVVGVVGGAWERGQKWW